MAIIGKQPSRDSYAVTRKQLDEFVAYAAELATKHSTSIETVIEASRVLEMGRRNDIAVEAGNHHDEHIGGLGDAFAMVADALQSRELLTTETAY